MLRGEVFWCFAIRPGAVTLLLQLGPGWQQAPDAPRAQGWEQDLQKQVTIERAGRALGGEGRQP